jgi:hypothetical protein
MSDGLKRKKGGMRPDENSPDEDSLYKVSHYYCIIDMIRIQVY